MFVISFDICLFIYFSVKQAIQSNDCDVFVNKQSIYLSICTLHQPPASDMYWQNIIKLIMIITFTFSIVNCTKEKKEFLK